MTKAQLQQNLIWYFGIGEVIRGYNSLRKFPEANLYVIVIKHNEKVVRLQH